MTDLKKVALQICRDTLAAIDIPATMSRKIARENSFIRVNREMFDLARFNRILVVSIGKASLAMAQGLSEALGPRYKLEGILVAPALPGNVPAGFRSIVAGHPIPNENSLEAGAAILELLATANERTLIFFLLSGGASSLVEQPLDPRITLADLRELNTLLVNCGASISEINAVRKHLSAVKGGRLAAASPLAMKITFAITDVPDGQESALASGPTLPDPTTIDDVLAVVEKYKLISKLPTRVRQKFENATAVGSADTDGILETPKSGDAAFNRSAFQILLDRHDLFHPAHCCAEGSGFVTVCDNTTDNWPIGKAADYLLAQLAALKRDNPGRKVAVIADGEVTSPVTGDGIGGRNSAFVLDCVSKIAEQPVAVLSIGTDGIDGTSPAAGAIADGYSLIRASEKDLDPVNYFRRSDSYTFFNELGDAIMTGPTGNNLRDLRILLSE